MVEKKDVPMNTFQQVTDAEYIYAEAIDGSQVKIKKSDFVELVRANIPLATQSRNGLMSAKGIIYKGNVAGEDLKNIGSSFGYSYASDGSGIYGTFLSLVGTGNYVFQLKVSNEASAFKFRIFNPDKDQWSSWKSISFT